MTHPEIADALRALADRMEILGAAMCHYSGHLPPLAIHGTELQAASEIAREWAAEIDGGAT